jgi:hypothetical protein
LAYERTTVRDVGARASMDAVIVMRYFGKEGLFARASALIRVVELWWRDRYLAGCF